MAGRRRPGRRHDHLISPCHRRCLGRSPRCLAFACCTTTTSRRLTFAPFDAGICRMAAEDVANWRCSRIAPTSRWVCRSTTGRNWWTRGSIRQACCRSWWTQRGLPKARPVPALESLLQDGLANILFVGRVAPNKKIEDHIRLAEQHKRYVDIYYRFIFVGNYNAVPSYYAMVRAPIVEHKMLPDRFWSTGPVPDEELAAYYRHAHACLAERA